MIWVQVSTTINKGLFIATLFFSLSGVTFAKNEVNINNIVIPVLDNAQIFSKLLDGTPAVLNYFTNATKEQIIDFYQKKYGEAIIDKQKHEQLVLVYNKSLQTIRIVISQQGDKRQVDIIVK